MTAAGEDVMKTSVASATVAVGMVVEIVDVVMRCLSAHRQVPWKMKETSVYLLRA